MSRICKKCYDVHSAFKHTLHFVTRLAKHFWHNGFAKHSVSNGLPSIPAQLSSFGSWTFTCEFCCTALITSRTHSAVQHSSIWTHLFELIYLNLSLWAHPSELISLSSSIWTHLFELIPGFQTSMPTSFAKSSITILTLHASGTHTHTRLLIKWEPPSPRTTWKSTALSMY